MIDEKSPYFRERSFIVSYSEMDFHRVMKPSAMLNFLQDLATFAADECGFGYAEVDRCSQHYSGSSEITVSAKNKV